ncbi:tripartite tricarboxylate transporter permease [Pseudomonas matsuisoli]|uniref:C4-dicarboxylate ABC transporter permease n=1 Tax=Pseudomonas matsuisoli TaxID=1515666 RepID=A0A917PIY3_9PSED|nr:tripartite tricarboxylate transporter permease [Pseudomonas matsuisoli]GGJ80445.1 C4-dicarboxylate ABC transporter permease [Pseudomonas matsuisoli]
MLLEGILSVLNLQTLLLITGGTLLGIIIGSIPGLTVTMGVALFLPVTFAMSPVDGLSLLMGLYIGGTSGGLISAVLLKIPGTPSSVATTFDGHPMAERGEAGKALSVSIICSFLGGMFSLLVLFFVAPKLAEVAVQFGPYEYFAIALFSLTLVAGLSGDSLARGLVAAGLGLTVAFVGMAPITAFPRFTFGWSELDAGISLLPALIGLFAVSQVLEAAESRKVEKPMKTVGFNLRQMGFSIRAGASHALNWLRSSVIGTGIGILPGLGGAVCNILAYGAAKKYSKHPEKFGTGITDGLVASESSNNASTGGALVPLMTLGIPGDNTAAILLAGFMIHGITPGPMLFETQGVLVYGIFTALVIANVVMVLGLFGFMRGFVRVLSVPKHILLPVVMMLCVIGAYGINNRLFDVGCMLAFGVLGWLMKKANLPTTPLLLGFILGPIIETNLRRGLMSSRGDFLPFLTEPISGLTLLAAFAVVAVTAYRAIRPSQKASLLPSG